MTKFAANGANLKRRFQSLKSTPERSLWESHCEEISQVVMPRKRGFVGEVTPGEKRMQRVYSSVGIRANELLAAGLHGFATNPAAKWFSLSLTDERLTQDPDVKIWLSDVEDIIWSRMYSPGTNFITALHEIYLELGAFGTGALFTDWNEDNENLTFEARSLAHIVVAESNRGILDTFFRKFSWTARQIVLEWGLEAVSDEIKVAMNNQRFDQRFDVCHAIYPRDEFNNQAFGLNSPQNMPVASIYFELSKGHLLEEGGYPEMPYAAPRWTKVAGEIMGRSPAMTALPDIKMMQEMKLTTIKAGQKATDPPLFALDDGFVNPLLLIPGGVNFTRRNPRDTVFPMPFTGNLPFAQQEMDILRNDIFDTFHVNQLQIVTDSKMTATEVMQRTQERMRLLGPVLGRLESELLGPLITRVFGVLHRVGLLPEAPEQIQGKEFSVRYVSPIAQAQRAVEIDTWQQFLAGVGVYLQNPETAQAFFQLYPVHKVSQHFAKLLNLDPDMGASEEEIEAGNRQAQMQQLMQSAGPFQQAASGVKDLSDAGTNLGENVSNIQGLQQQIDPNQVQRIGDAIQQRAQAA